MKKRFSTVKFGASLLFLLFGLLFQTVHSQSSKPFSTNESPLPAPTGFVNDYAGVLDGNTKQKLEAQIKDFKQKTNPPVELAVAIVNTTGDRPIFDYSLAVARGWGIGSKNQDNPSALLFIAIQDRKYFTQVSRDLEDELPDGLVGSLQRQYLVPEFKKGDYNKGISDTIDAYIRTIEARRSGEPLPNATPETTYQPDIVDRTFDAIPNSVCRCACIIILILFLIAVFSGRGKGGGGSGRGGGSGDGIASGLLWAILAGAANSSSGSSSSWGGSSSSDWGSSGGGWGGFGGGGDFGGGGAGGDW